MSREDLWRRFRDEHPEVPAKQIETLWRDFLAQHDADGAVEVPKRRGRPPGSRNRTAEPVEQ